MSAVEISVRGVARRRFRPEQGVLGVSINLEGPSRESVYRDAVALHGALTEALADLEAGGAVSRWSSESVRVFGYRPVDAKGRRREPIYSTRIPIEAEFVDFEALSQYIDRWATTEGVTVGAVDWNVRDDNRRTYAAELRQEAVADAVAKAQSYADAVGRGTVVATHLADPNMLSESRPAPMVRAAPAAKFVAAQPPEPELELRPEDIELSVAVDARFVAE
ncbi:SIMPL domain-containing protein [Gordonia sp. CPCC 206044]|uniref:SIMPL domain-containing protein n=1 Tax=Gordonia sp. CPCC 206044 TaxID=3140793 RepID=UPI003AF3C9EC